jgi:hypothetical protein
MTIKQCSPCTACCDGWLTAEIRGNKVKPWKPCIYSMKQGCGIYENRPENPCVVFKCAWLQEKHKLPEHMKPSECGAIVLLDRDWMSRKAIRAVPVGKKIPSDTLEWLKAYAREQSLPLLFSEFLFKENGELIGKRKIGYGPPSFIREVETSIEPDDIMMF